MNALTRRYIRSRKLIATALGSSLLLSGCDFGSITTTTTTTLDGRDVITQLINAALITPIQNVLAEGVDNFFDEVLGDDDDA